MSLACDDSEGVAFAARTQLSSGFISRMNAVSEKMCEIYDRTNVAEFEIKQYCSEVESPPLTDSSSSSSSSSECFQKQCGCSEVAPVTYLISDEDWDEDMIDMLVTLEQDVCETVRKLKELEENADNDCTPTSSSLSSSSSEAPSSSSSEPPPSSSSSEAPSSSSSAPPSSSSSSGECCKPIILIISECEALGITEPLELFGIPELDPLLGDCRYVIESIAFPPSSSSSSSSVASSSSYDYSGFSVYFDIGSNRWEITYNDALIASFNGPNSCSPYGSYLIDSGECAGNFITVE